jgi:hypothetical protein
MRRSLFASLEISFLLLCALLGPVPSGAADLDAPSAEALEKTKELLVNPTLREEALAKDPNAKKADDGVKKLGLSKADEESMYHLSGAVFDSMVKSTGGNVEALQKKLQDYARNPAAFEKDLTPAQREEIRRLGNALDAQSRKAP